jgi:hypothetical protein
MEDSRPTRRDVLALLALFAAAGEARGQDPVKASPRQYRVVLENDKVRVLEYWSRPGLALCGQGRHYHPAHLTISLTDVKARVTLDDGRVIVAQDKPGDMFWAPAGYHVTENLGSAAARAYVVEYKDKDWKPSTWSEKG